MVECYKCQKQIEEIDQNIIWDYIVCKKCIKIIQRNFKYMDSEVKSGKELINLLPSHLKNIIIG